MNINQFMIRPLMQNVTILVLFLMPAITMRTYSEEKRSGTIELLLTSPLTDFQIILGKFLGALALYAVMLAVSLIHIALLFVYGNPEWKPIVDRLSGSAAVRRLLHLGWAVHLEPDEESGRGRAWSTFGVFLLLWVINWIGSFSDRPSTSVTQLSVDHRPLRRLREGRDRHDAPDLLRELHHVRSVPYGQVGRQRTVAGLRRW